MEQQREAKAERQEARAEQERAKENRKYFLREAL